MRLKGRPFLLILDILVFLLCSSLVYFYRFQAWDISLLFVPSLWVFISVLSMSLYILGAFEIGRESSYLGAVAKTFVGITITLFAAIVLNYFAQKSRAGLFGRGVLLTSFVSFGVVASTYRILLIRYARKALRSLHYLVMSDAQVWPLLKNDLLKHKVISQFSVLLPEKIANEVAVVGTWKDYKQLQKQNWTQIVLAQSGNLEARLEQELLEDKMQGQAISDLVLFYEKVWNKVPVYYLNHSWFLSSTGFALVQRPIQLRVKRIFDMLAAVTLLLLVWPIMLLAALLIKLESKGPAIFTQTRTGLNGETFTIYKFRSMRIDAEKDGAQWAQKNDSRVTFIGKWIRLTRIDELPQLLNVIKGDMSFIGPRPERPEFNVMLEKEIPFYNVRHSVPPGLTGWAQVLYPYGASIEDSKEKLQFELFYIKNYSLLLDLRILLKTVRIVLFGRGR